MKKLFVLVFVVFISGCSTKFAYRNIDWLAYWYIDDYIEFTDEQEDIFDEKLQTWLAWHKNEELPKYISHIEQIRSEVMTQKMSLERMSYHQEKTREHWERFRDYIIPDLVEMAPLLSDEQVTYMFAALEKENKEREEKIEEREALSIEKRQATLLKRNKKEMRKWLGKLSDEQEKLLENTLPQFEFNARDWLEYTRVYQSQLRALFTTDRSSQVFTDKLTTLLRTPENYRSPELVEKHDKNTELTHNLMLNMLILSSEKQMKRFDKEAKSYQDDFVDLSDD